MFGNHCINTDFVWLQALSTEPATFQETSESTRSFRVLRLVVMKKSFLTGLMAWQWQAVTFWTVKPQYPALAGFHKCSQMKFVSLRFFGLIPNITVQTCSVPSLQNCDLCPVHLLDACLGDQRLTCSLA